jgi:hypothetical protein
MPLAAQRNHSAPETFTANLQAKGDRGGAAAATVTIDIKRYTPEAERTAVEQALKTGGFAGFVAALRKAPAVGTVTFGEQSWTIRWAREQPGTRHRIITLVTDSPIFFVGGGSSNAKDRTGYDVALIQMRIEVSGLGNGTMAAAARVKPGGETGVQVDDYAENPIKMVSIMRKIQ